MVHSRWGVESTQFSKFWPNIRIFLKGFLVGTTSLYTLKVGNENLNEMKLNFRPTTTENNVKPIAEERISCWLLIHTNFSIISGKMTSQKDKHQSILDLLHDQINSKSILSQLVCRCTLALKYQKGHKYRQWHPEQ